MKPKIMPITVMFLLLSSLSLALEISSVSVTPHENYATIEWSTDKLSDSRVEYGANNNLGAMVENNDSVTQHIVNLMNLTENMNYFFKVNSCTNESECASSDISSFSIIGDVPDFSLTITPEPGMKNIVNTTRYRIKGVTEDDVMVRVYINRQDNPDAVLITHLDGTSNYLMTTDITGVFDGFITLSSGINNITIEGKKQGRVNSVNLVVHCDVVKPGISFDQLPDATKSEMIDIFGTVSEKVIVEVLIDDAVVDYFNASGRFNRTNLTIGRVDDGSEQVFEIRLKATDKSGNSDFSTAQDIKVDKKSPDIDFTTDLSLSTYSTIFKIEGTTEPYAKVKVINIGNFSDITHFRDESAAVITTMDITGLILGKERTTEADSSGYFSIKVNLFEGTNTLYFEVKDDVGNNIEKHERITMTAGDAQWRISLVEGYPPAIFFHDMRKGYEATAFVVLDWVGHEAPIDATISSAELDDRKRGDNELVSSITKKKSYYDATNKKLYGLLSVRIKPWSGSADELFKHLSESFPKVKFEKQLIAHFKLRVQETYSDGPGGNAIKYDKVAYAIEKPAEIDKFLTPKMINSTLKSVIEPTINFLNKVREYSLYLSGVSLVTCGATIAANYIAPLAGAENTDDYKKAVYWACDRVICPSVPPNCEGEMFERIANTTTFKYEHDDSRVDVTYIDYNSTSREEKNRCPDGTNTIIRTNKYDISQLNTFFSKDIKISKSIRDPSYGCTTSPIAELTKDGAVPDAKQYLGCYYAELEPFDKSKCLGQKSGKGINPSEDIISAFRCGCTTSMYGHTVSVLRIFDAMKKCMEQAMIGDVREGFCERMLLIYTCDIAIDLFKYMFKEFEGITPKERGGAFSRYQDNAEDLKDSLINRYKGDWAETMRLTPEKIVNDACLFAFTGDLSLMEGAVENIVTRKPIAPYAMVMASSRQGGYDPFVGRMRINYNIYVGIVPGGPTDVELKLVCDRSKEGGEYCPTEKIEIPITQNIPRTLTRDDFIDVNILHQAYPADYWFNRIVLSLRYYLGNESRTLTKDMPVRKHESLSYGCTFSISGGITCKAISIDQFGSVELIPTTGGLTGTHVSPTDSITYYPGNKIALAAKIKNSYDKEFYLNMNLTQPNGRSSSIQYKIDQSLEPRGELQYYNFLIDKLYGGTVGEITYSGYKTVEEEKLSEKDNVYLRTDKEYTQRVTYEDPETMKEIVCDAEKRTEDPKRCNIKSGTLTFRVRGATEELTVSIYSDEDGGNLIDEIKTEKDSESPSDSFLYASGNYRVKVDIYKDENQDDRGDTPVPFDTNSQALEFRFNVENQIPEHCNKKSVMDILEPTGDFIFAMKNDDTINIGANIVDDCNQISYIEVIFEDEYSNRLCSCKVEPKEGETFKDYENKECPEQDIDKCSLKLISVPDEYGTHDGGESPYYRFELTWDSDNNMEESTGVGRENYYRIRFNVMDTRAGADGSAGEAEKTVQIGKNVTKKEIELVKIEEEMKIEKGRRTDEKAPEEEAPEETGTIIGMNFNDAVDIVNNIRQTTTLIDDELYSQEIDARMIMFYAYTDKWRRYVYDGTDAENNVDVFAYHYEQDNTAKTSYWGEDGAGYGKQGSAYVRDASKTSTVIQGDIKDKLASHIDDVKSNIAKVEGVCTYSNGKEIVIVKGNNKLYLCKDESKLDEYSIAVKSDYSKFGNYKISSISLPPPGLFISLDYPNDFDNKGSVTDDILTIYGATDLTTETTGHIKMKSSDVEKLVKDIKEGVPVIIVNSNMVN